MYARFKRNHAPQRLVKLRAMFRGYLFGDYASSVSVRVCVNVDGTPRGNQIQFGNVHQFIKPGKLRFTICDIV